MAKFYCKYCGSKESSINNLTSFKCPRHPDGDRKGTHALYEGEEKKEYICKYCESKASSISSLTSFKCPRHPNGDRKGYHSPAL